ncbi:MAG: tetratricopeptide repeat protein [Oscillospiraceae bacterium]|nr:tetratricopeptide repeat protein [Oscillospiraceae bacterium]
MKLIKCECCGGNSLRKYDGNGLICDFCGSIYRLDENEEIISKEVVDAKLMSLFIDAEKCREAEKYLDALQIYIKALELDEHNAVVRVKLGRAYRECGSHDKALECYNKAISIDPNFPTAYSNIGAILLFRKDYQGALEYYEKSMELISEDDTDYPTVLANYAMTLAFTGDKKQAAVLLDKAEKKGYKNGAAARKIAGISFWSKLFG